MPSRAAKAAGMFLALAVTALLPACSATTKQVPEDQATLKKIGLPVYPGATAYGTGMVSSMNTPMGSMVTTMARFVTNDDFESVKAFYLQRSPASRREVSLPLGKSIKDAMFQYIEGSYQKQIQIVEFQGFTMISLSSTDLRLERASPSPAASTSP